MPHRGRREERQPWRRMSVTPMGRVPDVIQQGGGKLTPPGGDPGEPRKQKPTG
jgi:hypothetical protein